MLANVIERVYTVLTSQGGHVREGREEDAIDCGRPLALSLVPLIFVNCRMHSGAHHGNREPFFVDFR